MNWYLFNCYNIAQYINILLNKFVINRLAIFPTNYKWCEYLRSNYKTIYEEYLDYVKNNKLQRVADFDKNQAEVDTTDIPWEILVLRLYNKDTNKITYFPKTYELIKNIPDCTSIMFSVLLPGKIFPMHCGAYKGVLRYHLGLLVPKESNKCYIKINDELYVWQEGKDLLFDDTQLHYVNNATNETRVILMLDIKRKFNNRFINLLNTFILYISKFTVTVKNIINKVNNH